MISSTGDIYESAWMDVAVKWTEIVEKEKKDSRLTYEDRRKTNRRKK